jgi:CrcB protein
MIKPVLAISIGAALGALLRWALGLKLNAVLEVIPFGTVAANLLAAYVIGLATAYFATTSNLSPEWKLLIITGFCGGLSTFSTFSMEIVTLLQRQQFAWAAGSIGLHVVGSVLMTLAGMATWQLLRAG